ncbi:hypothetical protein BGZ63DRAFT_393005 [Mariannaea sp. PMI_226]|nr:hypothetical protein BGZ63DRAFT_393005 [Mariannaea sp. PMI_226]
MHSGVPQPPHPANGTAAKLEDMVLQSGRNSIIPLSLPAAASWFSARVCAAPSPWLDQPRHSTT